MMGSFFLSPALIHVDVILTSTSFLSMPEPIGICTLITPSLSSQVYEPCTCCERRE
jgi:hypothetical protein